MGLQTQPPQSAPSPSPAQKKRGLSQLRSDEAREGSRVTITYNEPLSDYSAYRSGNQFVVVIPKADAPRIRSGLRGRGFEGVQVEKRGEDTVLSFRIQPGVKARVAQQNNRLEVIFSSPGQAEANTATTPQQAAAAVSSPTPGKAPQGTQAPAVLPQPPLANHNSTNADGNQTKGVGASVDSSAEPNAATAQTGASAAPIETSPTEISTTSSQPSADVTSTEKTMPAVVPHQTGFAAARMMMTRHWLPVLIGTLLLMSAYGIINARRRTERSSSIPAAHAEEIEENEAETEALSRANSAAIASSVEETRLAHITETEIAAETDVVQQVALAEDVTPEAPDATMAGIVSTEQHKGSESRASESPLISDEALGVEVEEAPEIEDIEVATSQSNPVGTSGSEAVQMLLSEEPIAVERDGAHTPETDLNKPSSATERERAAAVMDLAHPGSEDTFVKIGAAFDDPSQQVRERAARSLFNFSADRVASFKRIMQESSIERRRRIGAAIASSGMAMEAIKDLTSQSGTRAYEALLVLSLMAKAGEVESLILAIEEHPNTEVRLALVKLLALSGERDVLSAFRHLATRDSLPIAVRSSIMEAIYQINNPRPFDLSQT
ncbi:MAG: hypothetical protein H0X14_05080, partial [Acidobacteria bacterium]|nr:hypothetical protein [Acidobacteriota bacterium]